MKRAVPSLARQPVKPVALRHLRELGIAEFKLPDRITCVDALPLTPVGKVDKNVYANSLLSRRKPDFSGDCNGYSKTDVLCAARRH